MDIWCTERNEGLARLNLAAVDAAEIRGAIRGPFCKYSHTLPCTHTVSNGEACIVDPCYWSPTLPFRYEVCLEIDFQNGDKEQVQFLWGLRRCVPHKHDLRLNGKRYVIRAVHPDRPIDLAELRHFSAALVTSADNEKLCEEASEMGVVLIVADDSVTEESYRKLNLFPAVHFVKDFVAVDAETDLLDVASDPSRMPGSELVWMDEANDLQHFQYSKPIFVEREIHSRDIADMRKACDQLQRDLAKYGQYAGYVIRSSDVF